MLNRAVPLPIMLGKCTMVPSTDANKISRDQFTYKTETLNLKNGQVHRCPQLMLWGGIQWDIN